MLTIEVSLEALWMFVSEMLELNKEESKTCLQENLRRLLPKYKRDEIPWQMNHIDSEWDITMLAFAISKSQINEKQRSINGLLTIRNQIVHRPNFAMSDCDLHDKVERAKRYYEKLLTEMHARRLSEKLENIKKRENAIFCVIVFWSQYSILLGFAVHVYVHNTECQLNYGCTVGLYSF